MLRLSSPVRRKLASWTAAAWRLARPATSAAIALAAFVVAVPTAGASTTGSLRLASQSAYVSAPGKFSIAVTVTSELPRSALGLQFSLYSDLSSRQAFALSTRNAEFPSQTCLDKTTVLPLTSHTFSVRGVVVAPTCATTTNTFSLQGCTSGSCNGVYPLVVALIERSSGRVIRSFTTHVVVATPRQASKVLQVGLVIPLGGTPSLRPDGSPALGRSLTRLSAVVRALGATPAHLSVSLSPDLLLALKKVSGTRPLSSRIDALVAHGRPGARVEILSTPYADVDASALAASGLGADVSAAVAAGQSALEAHFGHPLQRAPYASSTPMTSEGISTLQRACLNEFVLPQRSILFADFRLTPTAPLLVGTPALCDSSLKPPVAFVADQSLGAELSANTHDPVLAGENVLADLAQVYFEGPFDPDPRAVVAVASPSIDPRVLGVVLAGLRTSPILRTASLTDLFQSVPPGSNQNLTVGKLGGALSGDAPPAGAVRSAKGVLAAVKATMPNNAALISRLNDSLLTAESARMSTSRRDAYLNAPVAALATIGKGLSIVASKQITLTSRSGNVPIAIQSTVHGVGPVNVVVRLSGSSLIFRPNQTTRHVQLVSKDTDITPSVETHTSGLNDLQVAVYSAIGHLELRHRNITVRSTAVSGQAIAISAAALALLLAWWLRSIVRTRRRKASAAAIVEA